MKACCRIAIVGAGPMGTYALERLAAHLPRRARSLPVKVLVFERGGEFGGGSTHGQSQASTSYLNRVASQLSFAADESISDAGVLLEKAMRPTFYEWVRERFVATGDPRFDLLPTDVPQRYLHGMALRAAFDRYVQVLRDCRLTDIELIHAEVVDLESVGDSAYRLTSQAGDTKATHEADFVLLATGHSRNAAAPGSKAHTLRSYAIGSAGHAAYVDYPYPLQQKLDETVLPPGSPMVLMGMGLTAIDTLMHLTEGRGGQFVPRDGHAHANGIRYVPSGREPRIVVASPSGMFTSCRPHNEKALDGSGATHTHLEHKGQFLTEATIRSQRDRWGRIASLPHGEVRQLDFERHIFPIIVLEMAYAYYKSLLGLAFAEDFKRQSLPAFANFLLNGGAAQVGATVEMLLCAGQAAFDRLDVIAEVRQQKFAWRRLFWPLDDSDAETPERWAAGMLRYLKQDLAQAMQGNLSNPAKAACDGVWRDLRSLLSMVLDFGGLTAASQRQFVASYFRLYTRMSNGTGAEPMSKLLALVEQGIIDVSVGPDADVQPDPASGGFVVHGGRTGACIHVTTAVEGRGHSFDAQLDESPLYRNMMRRGIVRLWRNPGGQGEADFMPGALDVCSSLHPLGAKGQAQPRLTIFGAPIEGLLYFQLSAARPASNSSILRHPARWAKDLMRQLPPEPAADLASNRDTIAS